MSRGCSDRSRVSSLDVKGHELESLGDCGAFCGFDIFAVGCKTVEWGRGCHLGRAPLLVKSSANHLEA